MSCCSLYEKQRSSGKKEFENEPEYYTTMMTRTNLRTALCAIALIILGFDVVAQSETSRAHTKLEIQQTPFEILYDSSTLEEMRQVDPQKHQLITSFLEQLENVPEATRSQLDKHALLMTFRTDPAAFQSTLEAMVQTR